jgi:hypothetical protein
MGKIQTQIAEHFEQDCVCTTVDITLTNEATGEAIANDQVRTTLLQTLPPRTGQSKASASNDSPRLTLRLNLTSHVPPPSAVTARRRGRWPMRPPP